MTKEQRAVRARKEQLAGKYTSEGVQRYQDKLGQVNALLSPLSAQRSSMAGGLSAGVSFINK